LDTCKIAVLGLGYVGLPLAIAFGGKYRVKGFDISRARVDDLNKGDDFTGEADAQQLLARLKEYNEGDERPGICFTHVALDLADCNVFIVTVPTPVNSSNAPDLSFLIEATRKVAENLKKGGLVIYESTVYPGCTEEVAVPILEQVSGLTFNIDFFCGYSPERINPGDKTRTISQIRKITSGSTQAAANQVDDLYASIISAGTYQAPSIKVAEAAKVIENTQRDINIAFVNELAKIFERLGIDTKEVLKAAATKWNFLPFEPGLVGGHCIGIDPYYLAHKSMTVGYRPDLILAARAMNDSMGEYVALRVIELMAKKGILKAGAEVLVMGITFKENFADVRNSRVVDIVKALKNYHLSLTIFDPIASPLAVKETYNLDCCQQIPVSKKYAAIIVAVNHNEFSFLDYSLILQVPGVLFDVKGVLTDINVDGRL
jgi:UDP-N-acetyl-D-galactosamine dehydrogenase